MKGKRHRLLLAVGIILFVIAIVGGGWKYLHHSKQVAHDSKNGSSATANTPNASPGPAAQPAFNKQLYSTSEAGSLWWVVSKTRPLPSGYVPPNLVTASIPRRGSGSEMTIRDLTNSALVTMADAAKKDGANLMLASGYRSYQLQVSVYNANVAKLGQAGADAVSAKPGTSEHQTGLAADLEPTSRKCEVEVCFADTPEGKWLSLNAYKYGFILRYPQGKENVTGYSYEPWHFRYVGTDLSMEMHRTGMLTMEEFFGLPAYKQ